MANIPNSYMTGTTTSGISNSNPSQFLQDFQDFIGWGTARREREYNTYMANTAYQRAAQDMISAGLNPAQLFAGAGGNPAGTGGYGGAAHASLGGAVGTLTGIANVVRAFNNDKNQHNDMTQRKAIHFLNTAAKIIKNFK